MGFGIVSGWGLVLCHGGVWYCVMVGFGIVSWWGLVLFYGGVWYCFMWGGLCSYRDRGIIGDCQLFLFGDVGNSGGWLWLHYHPTSGNHHFGDKSIFVILVCLTPILKAMGSKRWIPQVHSIPEGIVGQDAQTPYTCNETKTLNKIVNYDQIRTIVNQCLALPTLLLNAVIQEEEEIF